MKNAEDKIDVLLTHHVDDQDIEFLSIGTSPRKIPSDNDATINPGYRSDEKYIYKALFKYISVHTTPDSNSAPS